MRSLTRLGLVGIAAAGLLAPGQVSASVGAQSLAAANIQFVNQVVYASTAVGTVTFANLDNGVTHNVTEVTGLFSTGNVVGAGTGSFSVAGLTPGNTYFFLCTVHPTLMKGVLNAV